MKKQTKRFAVLAAVVAVAALAALSSCFVVTQQNQYNVIRQFGKVVDVRTQPGISMKIPFIQQSSTIPNTMLLYDLPISDVITKDKKTMVADSFVLWRVDDPYRFIQNLNGQLSVAEDRLSTNVYNAMKTSSAPRPRPRSSAAGTASWPSRSRTMWETPWSSTASSSSPWRPSTWTCPTTTRRPSTSG